MDFDEINKILDIVREHELSEFELEREGFKIRIKKGHLTHVSAPFPAQTVVVPHAAPSVVAASVPTAPAPEAVTRPEPAETPAASEEVDLAIVKSPIVGTFFRSSEPGA